MGHLGHRRPVRLGSGRGRAAGRGVTLCLGRPGDGRVNCHNFSGIYRVTHRFEIGYLDATF